MWGRGAHGGERETVTSTRVERENLIVKSQKKKKILTFIKLEHNFLSFMFFNCFHLFCSIALVISSASYLTLKNDHMIPEENLILGKTKR